MAIFKLVLCILLLWMSIFQNLTLPRSDYDSGATRYSRQIRGAISYLVGHYNSSLGLIYESEGLGVSWLKNEYPDFNLRYPQVYWLYSDNLFSSLALAQWEPEIAGNISRTISLYHVPPSSKFESVNGSVTGLDRAADNIILKRTATYAILIRIQNGSLTAADCYYADDATYRALSLYYEGRTQEAATWLNHVFDMWNGTCLADEGAKPARTRPTGARTDANYCDQYKIGLALFAARVIGINYAQIAPIEQFLWSAQNELGGIRSLTQSGIPSGTANCETTSLALLQYNRILIEKLHNQTASTTWFTSALVASSPIWGSASMTTISVIVLVIIALVVAFEERRTKKG